jgi:hypothetical protein
MAWSNAGESLRDRRGRGSFCPGPEERLRSEKSPTWSVARRAACVQAAHAGNGVIQEWRLAALHALDGRTIGGTSLDRTIRAKARKRQRMPGAIMKRRPKIERLRLARHRNANQKFSTNDEDADSDGNPISKSILRKMMDVSEVWRTCRRRTCKRGRGCRGRDVQCASERVFPKPRNPEKAARDQARSMAMLQRMLRERLEEVRHDQEQIAPQQAAPSGRRRRD